MVHDVSKILSKLFSYHNTGGSRVTCSGLGKGGWSDCQTHRGHHGHRMI